MLDLGENHIPTRGKTQNPARFFPFLLEADVLPFRFRRWLVTSFLITYKPNKYVLFKFTRYS